MSNRTPRSIKSIVRRGYEVKVIQYLSNGLDIFVQNSLDFIVFSLIIVAARLAIPYAGVVIIPQLKAGLTISALKSVKQQAISRKDFFAGFSMFFSLLLAGWLTSIFIIIGFVLLIIPGIYLVVSYIFTVPLIVERKLDFWEAMESSRTIVSKQWFSMFGFSLVLGLINFVGLLFSGLLIVSFLDSALLIRVVGVLLGLIVVAITTSWSECCIVAAYQDIVGFLPSSENSYRA